MQRLNRLYKPHVMILATGGTIAGVAEDDMDYISGALHINALLETLPQIHTLAHIHTKQICNIDSADMNDDIWLKLVREVDIILEDDTYSGIIILHGTDTMEESAFFLHLVSKSHKPIVFTGAMYPPHSLCFDGGLNLYNALILATHNDAKGRGVMVCMNNRIYSARYVSKAHTLNIDSFSSASDIGYIANNQAYFYTSPHGHYARFSVENLVSLPRVDILYSYSNDGSSVAALAFFKAGAKGIVIAGSGAGSIHKSHKQTLENLIKEGLVVVISSRINQGRVHLNKATLNQGFISSGDLNPQKARILLLLALSSKANMADIATIFHNY